MKKKYMYVIIGELIIILFLIFLLYLKCYSHITVDTKGVENITIVNNLGGTAKQVTQKQDIESICNLFNSLSMHKTKNLKRYHEMLGGSSYTFIFYYKNGLNLQIICNDNSYLINNANFYRVNNTQFEKLWELDYEEKKYTYQGIK